MFTTLMKVTTLDSLPIAYVSHDSAVEKKVLLKFGEVPHVPQLAVATLKPGEQATMHFHKDMTETFHFQSGTGDMEVNGKVNTGSENLVVIYFGIV
ncbi:hypothetical protein BGZ99_000920 [Dissophora globulifera]|uniref:Cupin domain-containing protein n=1 Tax=Dissophora globulifera TaxID=979702 RepID=A0A9P6UKR4_9FUNG|nr:hypothetical protein BGZ99_000920 [Dissophora globulifera]